MPEVLEFFRQPNSTDFAMDPYGTRMVLEIDVGAEFKQNETVTIRGRLLKDGQPFPGIPWPRDPDDGDIDTTWIGMGQAVMGLQVEKDHCGSPFHWELEMRPQPDGWFSVTSDVFTKIPGQFVFKISAEGWFERNPAPKGKITAFFRNQTGSFQVRAAAQQPAITGVWVAGSLGSAGPSANHRHRIRFALVDANGQTRRAAGVFVLPMIPRIPNANIGNGGLVIDGRRIALDSRTGDLYLSGYSGPTGPGQIERISRDGVRAMIPLPGIANPEASAVAVNSRSRTLWLRFARKTCVVDLNSLQIVDQFDSLLPVSMCTDLAGDGVWAILPQTSPQRNLVLSKIARDSSVSASVPAFTPNGRPGWLAPLQNGGVVSIGLRNRQTVIVATDANGAIQQQSARWTVGTVDLDADPETGEVSAVIADNRRRGMLQNLTSALQPNGVPVDPNGRFGHIQSLMTVARAAGDRTWVGGMQFNPNPPPGTEPGPIGHFGSVGQGMTFSPVQGQFRAISLARTFK